MNLTNLTENAVEPNGRRPQESLDGTRDPWPAFFGHARTAPLTLAELAAWFECHRNHVRDVVLPALDCRQIGVRWQLRLSDMPVTYWLSIGLVQQIALNCTNAEAAPSTFPEGV